MKKQYRREFAKQAAQDTIIQDLVQDVYYFSTEPVENVEVDRMLDQPDKKLALMRKDIFYQR